MWGGEENKKDTLIVKPILHFSLRSEPKKIKSIFHMNISEEKKKQKNIIQKNETKPGVYYDQCCNTDKYNLD